jgi:hypothetical protein
MAKGNTAGKRFLLPLWRDEKARVGIGRLKRRFQTENTIFFRLIKHCSATTLPQHLHYTFADVFAESEIETSAKGA